MLTEEDLIYFRERMHHHKVVGDKAIVELTAKELGELLDHIETLETKVLNYTKIYNKIIE